MAKFDAVVWDWNGTLLDDTCLCVEIMNKMLARRDLPVISLDFYRSVIEFPVIRYYEKLGFDFTAEPFETVSDEFVSMYQARWRSCALQTDAEGTILRLKEAGVGQSVLSASKNSYLMEQLEYYGVARLLDSVTGADNHHGRGKLNIAGEHAATLGADPARTLFIGDTAHDAEAARQAGCPCLLVSFGHYAGERLSHFGIPVADSMGDIVQFIAPSSGLFPETPLAAPARRCRP